MPQEYDSKGRVIAPERPTEEPSGSPAEKAMDQQTKILTEIRDMLCEITSKTPKEAGADASDPEDVRGGGRVKPHHTPKKKPGRPRKVHEHEV